MSITYRQLNLPDDLPAALFLGELSGMNIPHVADWPYRFSSWGLDDPDNTQAWLDGSGRLLGWVVLQVPFWAIDCVVNPDAPAHLYREMLTWAQGRAAEMAADGEGHPMWFISIAKRCYSQRRDLEALGFEDVSEDGDQAWSKVLFELDNDIQLQPMTLPGGLHIRSLDPGSEIQAYVDTHRAVFQSESMTHTWRLRSTQMIDYNNALDLVATAEDGTLAGFCVAWLRVLGSGETTGQIEPLGVRESHRGKKLSRALMTEAIQRLRDHGADQIYVETDLQRKAAMAAYTSMGFRVAHEVLVYRYIVPEK